MFVMKSKKVKHLKLNIGPKQEIFCIIKFYKKIIIINNWDLKIIWIRIISSPNLVRYVENTYFLTIKQENMCT